MSANLTLKAWDDIDGDTFGTTAQTGAAIPASGDFVTDTFTQGSDVNLSSHTGEVGATWTLHTSYSGTITNDSTLGRIYQTSSANAAYYASGTPLGADYCVQGDFYRASSTISNNFSLVLAFDTSADTGILFRLNDNGAGTVVWEILERVAGSNTSLVSLSAHIPTVGGAAVQGKVCRNGTAITAFFDGTQDTNFNVTTTITAIGKAGVRTSAVTIPTSTTGIHVDNFSAR